MSAPSPWSQQVVRTLADRFDIDVLDCNRTADPYQRSPLEETSVGELARVCRVHQVPPRCGHLNPICGARRLRAIHAATNAAPVLCLYGGMQSTIAWLSGLRPYVVYAVGSDVLKVSGPRRFLAARTLRDAAFVYANGMALTERTRALAPRADVRQLYLGIDVARFRPPAAAQFGPRFVCTRAFRPVYDNATVVRAIAALRALPHDFTCAFLSAGPLLKETKALAGRLLPPAVRERVSFAGGVAEERLVATLHASAVYISASHSDGASASLLEAMAAGLFPIVTDIPANREWITHRENGLLFPAGDSSALAAAMTETFTFADWMLGARAHNRQLVAERADTRTNLAELSSELAALAGVR